MRARLPRAAGAVLLAAQSAAIFVAVPLLLSRNGARRGWSGGRPGPANLLGAVPIAAGSTVMVWAVSHHYRAAPHGWGLAPDYLLATGPYRYSRNPMYVGEAAIWAGWTVLYGSVPVAGGLVVLVAVQRMAVRLEEGALHRHWGAAYDEYRARVPRYL